MKSRLSLTLLTLGALTLAGCFGGGGDSTASSDDFVAATAAVANSTGNEQTEATPAVVERVMATSPETGEAMPL